MNETVQLRHPIDQEIVDRKHALEVG